MTRGFITTTNNMVSTQNNAGLNRGKKAGAIDIIINLVVLGLNISILNFIELVC